MRPRDIALAVVAALVWGLVFAPMKLALHDAPPFLLTAMRFALAAFPAVFIVAPPKTSWRYVVGYGAFIGIAQFGLLFFALSLGMPPGLASLLMQMQAFITVGLAYVTLGERPTRIQLIAAAVALAGVAAIGSARLGRTEILPFALTLLASCCWSAGNLTSKFAGRVDALGFVVWSSLVTPLPMLALSYLTEPARTLEAIAHPTLTLILCVLALAWGGTLFSFAIWSRLLSLYPAATVGPFALIVPVAGMGASYLAFGETPRPIELVGAVLIMAGLVFNMVGDRLLRRR